MPLETQGKIVQAVNGQRFRRVGGNTEVVVDVRVISASSRDLTAEISDGRLRESVLPARRRAIGHAAVVTASRGYTTSCQHFTALVAKRLGILPFKLSDEVLTAMQGYSWPGNVRQIHNVIETMLILAPTDRNEPIDLDLLPAEIHNGARSGDEPEMDALMGLPLRGAREAERAYLVAQLQRFDGNVSRVATFIGMERSALTAN